MAFASAGDAADNVAISLGLRLDFFSLVPTTFHDFRHLRQHDLQNTDRLSFQSIVYSTRFGKS